MEHTTMERRILKAAGGRLAVIVVTETWEDFPQLLRDVRAALAASLRLRKARLLD